MAFTPTTWVDNSAPAITAAQLNRIETGIDEAHNLMDSFDQNQSPVVTAGFLWVADGSTYVARSLTTADVPVASVNTQGGTTYTLVLTDAGRLIRCNGTSAITITIPLNASVALPVNTIITGLQTGTGQITVAATAGVSLNARGLTAPIKTVGQGSPFTLIKTAADTWWMWGDITA